MINSITKIDYNSVVISKALKVASSYLTTRSQKGILHNDNPIVILNIVSYILCQSIQWNGAPPTHTYRTSIIS